jgi:type I restriction enzyme M protein
MNLIEVGIEKNIIKFDDERNFITYIQQNKKRNYNNPEEKVQAETFLALVLMFKWEQKPKKLI